MVGLWEYPIPITRICTCCSYTHPTQYPYNSTSTSHLGIVACIYLKRGQLPATRIDLWHSRADSAALYLASSQDTPRVRTGEPEHRARAERIVIKYLGNSNSNSPPNKKPIQVQISQSVADDQSRNGMRPLVLWW